MKSPVLLFSSLQGSCRNPVKPVQRTESLGLLIVWWYNKLTFCLCISSNQLLNFGLKVSAIVYLYIYVRRVETLATVIWEMKNKSKNFPVHYSTIPVVQSTVYTLPKFTVNICHI